MSVNLQKVRIPLLERLALLDMAERRGVSEEQALARLIRDAACRELIAPAAEYGDVTVRELDRREVSHER